MGEILRELIVDLKKKKVQGREDLEIRGLAADSRKVEKGFLFICIPGFNVDGHAFIPEALARGASALITEKEIKPIKGVTWIKVPNARYALSILANKFYGYPSRKLCLIGVGGTNGKTTTTYLVKVIMEEAGKKVALLGTIAYQWGSKSKPAPWTTPPSLELQIMLKKLVEEGFDGVVMEVTSHALVLDRVAGCEFDVGVFTNFSQDHLDFHQTMENYLEAETQLFRLLNQATERPKKKKAIINIDSPYAEHIIKNTQGEILTYGIERQADIKAHSIKLSGDGLRFRIITPVGEAFIESFLFGKHNVYNILAAIGVGINEGIGLKKIEAALLKLKSVPGRFEFINYGQSFKIVVDYAHTPDALQNVLRTARELTRGKVIVVFGCGGDRDQVKRPLMGEVAARYSDIIILTSDNPRSEAPSQIIKEIEVGVKRVKPCCYYLIQEDRLKAIKEALKLTEGGDLVLIAGKGHENYQIIKNKSYPFNDKEVVKRLLRESIF